MIKQLNLIKIEKNKYFLLFSFWLILTVININKAFHIDDTFHLEASQYIQEHPTKPMSGLINWKDDPTPIYSCNQPPLFFYLIAVFSCIFGYNEIPLHLFLSTFTFFALCFFQKILDLLSFPSKNTLLTLFAFCPALIINQNLMVDVPILALILGMAYFLLKTNYSNKLSNYIIPSILLGFGLLIKYSLLPLTLVLFLVIFLKREYRKLFVVLIPLLFLFLWSLWNYFEFGSIHLLDRPKGTTESNQFWTFMACLGSVSMFSISFIYGMFPLKIVKKIISIVLCISIGSILIFYFNGISEYMYTKLLNLAFTINGLVICLTLVFIGVSQIRKGFYRFLVSNSLILFLFFSSIGAFIILFAPFMATRHILLVFPFVLLLGSDLIDRATKSIKRLSIAITIILGLILGISDWNYAAFYKNMASSISIPKGKKVWTAGLWGWNWYSKKNGMIEYCTNQSKVEIGDYIVFPENAAKQQINKNLNLVIINKKWQEANLLSLFSVSNFASLYSSTYTKPSWTLSKRPLDTIIICEVKSIINDTTNSK
jgi:hypothetical protein